VKVDGYPTIPTVSGTTNVLQPGESDDDPIRFMLPQSTAVGGALVELEIKLNGTYVSQGTATVSVNAHPTNFRQTAGFVWGSVLHFEYAWGSTSGDLGDLVGCDVGEIATYPGDNPFCFPDPPFDNWVCKTNPTVINVEGHLGALQDNHGSGPIRKPYQEIEIIATQYYRYHCPDCMDTNVYENLDGPIYIRRAVELDAQTLQWKYIASKQGVVFEYPLEP